MKLWDFGHAVTRWHTVPTIGQQTLADHSWGVALIVSRCYRGKYSDKLMLIEAALDHDLAEAIVGDIPKYSRTKEHTRIENRVAEEHLLNCCGLPKDLENWLKWADLIEAGLYAQHQVKLGNQYFAKIVVNVNDNLTDYRGADCPPELWTFARENELCL